MRLSAFLDAFLTAGFGRSLSDASGIVTRAQFDQGRQLGPFWVWVRN